MTLFKTDKWEVKRRVGLKPHYYQEDSFVALEAGWNEGHKKLMAVLPTGSGKTVMAGEMIARRVERKQRCLIMAHTRKLATQFRDGLERDYGLHVGMEMAEHSSDDEPVVCATFQSMLNRVAKGLFHPEEFSLIVVDEGHRILGDGYQSLLTHFGNSDVLALTATPRRSDQKDLMKFLDAKVVDVPLDRLIREKFLAPLTIVNCPISIRLEGASKTGDYTDEEVAHAIEPYLESCAHALKEHGAGRCALAFLPLIEISKKFTAALNMVGVRAAHVDGTMKEKDVKKIIKDLEMGKLDVVCNSMLLTEGVDIRPVNCIMNLRPTKSWSLYCQIVGRATRTYDPEIHGIKGTAWPLKHDAMLLDPLWLCDELNPLKRPACLLAKDDEDEKAIMAKIAGGEKDLMKATESVAIDRAEALKQKLALMAKKKSRLVNAMEFFLKQGDLNGAEYEPIAKWQEGDITQGQRNVLISHEIDIASVKDKGHATLLIDAIMARSKAGLASAKQVKYAESLGLSNAINLPRETVAGYITAKKHNPNTDPFAGLMDL